MVTSSTETEVFDTTPRPVSVPAGKKADLVLEGGGVKGIGLVGAVLTLHEQGYEFPRAAGTSAGAITAALVAALQAAGKPLSLLEGYVNSVDYPRFQAEGWVQRALGPVGDIAELLLHMGDPFGGLSRRVARRDPRGDRDHDLRAAADGRPRELAARSVPLLARRAHRRHHPPQSRTPPVGLRQLRARPWPATHRRRGPGVDVDPVLLRTGEVARHPRPPTTV